jgi:CheY-like chemotaxis protein
MEWGRAPSAKAFGAPPSEPSDTRSSESEAPAKARRRVLVVDDEPDVLRILKRALANYGYEIDTVADGRVALEHVALARMVNRPFDVIVTDLHMPYGGLDVLRALRRRNDAIPVIFMTGSPQDSVLKMALREGAFRCLVKPLMPSVLRSTIDVAISHTR